MIIAVIAIVASILAQADTPSNAQQKEQALIDLSSGELPANLQSSNAEVKAVLRDGKPALDVTFAVADWPHILFPAPAGAPWDWSAYRSIVVDVYNPGAEPVDVYMRVDNDGADGLSNSNTSSATVPPRSTNALTLRFRSNAASVFWGMRGQPGVGPLAQGAPIDTARITAFQVFLYRPTGPCSLTLSNFRLIGSANGEKTASLPFVDKYGQYKHASWPGKITAEADLKSQSSEEDAELASSPGIKGCDEFGAWVDGPKLDATGWFRVQEVEGKWWFVAPNGHLFLSIGMDCVHHGDSTFVEAREAWFDWLPVQDDPLSVFYGSANGVHSMAETIGGKGRIYNFYAANLVRKYGDDWKAMWLRRTSARLRSWGFNTIGNWSLGEAQKESSLPFTATLWSSSGTRGIAGGAGYWGQMVDVFDPAFVESVDRNVSSAASAYAANPLCIGYFIDNELSWGSGSGRDIAVWSFASPVDQPSRQALIEQLKTTYTDVAALNTAWETDAKDWDSLRTPAIMNAKCGADLDVFLYRFARKYFETINSAVKRHAPNQLYLGCRFAGAPSMEIMKACAEIADVVSFNIYRSTVTSSDCALAAVLNKPIIIGEFHFGALDRGMFHGGLVETRNQQDRADHYRDYLFSIADCPSIIGCHWFQYVDQPNTGRHYDGENYNIGFVSITDTPYPEMVSAARNVHTVLYARRFAVRTDK